MKNLLSNVLGNSSFVLLNKAIIQKLGLDEAVLLGFIIDKWTYFNHDDFYYTIDDLSHDTGLSDRMCRKILQSLINKGILIKKEFTGLPPKQYYNINDEMILNLLNCARDNTIKSDSLIPSKNDRDKTSKNDSVLNNNIYNNNNNINNNNREKNNKEINNTNSKNIKKVAKSIFDEALELYPPNEKLSFSYDDWAEWVEYKKARSKNLTILTFKKNLQQLKSFGNLAKEAIDNSISNNWVGLFKPQQNINQNQSNSTNRNYKGGYLEAK
ncbi:hypothetical protein, partial [Campylobacter lanienae]|uniref:hypothetical protein n=1 Tax=Campylobacter lanienae TaxID=75658 RepID=UPI002A90E561